VARVLGHFGENGLVQKEKKARFIPLPDEKDELVAVVSEIDIPSVDVLKSDYIIFETNSTRDGLIVASVENEFFVGFLKKSKFEKFSGEKRDEFEILGSFYGILRIPERREHHE